jgi:aspartate-semialdehyde dehydrogenase
MTTLAVINPSRLVAREVRDRLEAEIDLWQELRLLTTSAEEVGTLTEARGTATIVQAFEPMALDGVDLAFVCGPMAEVRPVLEARPSATRAVLISSDASAGDAPPLVAGVNLEGAPTEAVVISPDPGTVHLAHLLRPLQALGLERAVATLLQPVSVLDASALDELFEQARALLSFQPVVGSASLPQQLAFNLLPVEGPPDLITEQLRVVLDTEVPLAVELLQAGVFHGSSASLYFELDPDPGEAAVAAQLREHPGIELLTAGERSLGPIDAASSEGIRVGELRRAGGRAGAYWLWSVIDNLTRGGADNALAVARALLAGSAQAPSRA